MASKVLLSAILLCLVQAAVFAEIAPRTIPINLNCGQQSSYKWLNLVQSSSQWCSYTITPYNIYVCQLLVEFNTNLMQPVSSGGDAAPVCRADSRIQIGKFEICGINSNQHVYVRFDGSNLYNKYIINTASAGGSYSIKVTQVLCPPSKLAQNERNPGELTQPMLPPFLPTNKAPLATPRTFDTDIMAPVGCDQYFTQTSGFVESINWNGATGKYPGNIQYNVCFKRPAGSSKISLLAMDFDLEYNNPLSQTGVDCYDPNNVMPGTSSDYVYIPSSRIGGVSQLSDYYCGTSLRGRTIESTVFGFNWFIFNAGPIIGPNPARRFFKFQYTLM